MKTLARRNIHLQQWLNFISGVTFLVPIVTLFYKFTGLNIAQIILVSNVSTFFIWLLELPTSVLADTQGRRKSIVYAAFANLLGALCILLFPSLMGFCIAAFLSALYWSFCSGTIQAFLDENLRLLDRADQFGKYIGHNMFLGNLAAIITPILATLVLKNFESTGFVILATLDVIFAAILLVISFKLKEISQSNSPKLNHTASLKHNIDTAKLAIHNVFTNSKIKLLLIYRTLANHVSFFPLILLPTLSDSGMPDWASGLVISFATVGLMISNKFAYKLAGKFSYNKVWVYSTFVQALVLILAAFYLESWLVLVGIFAIFNILEGLWEPAWNHVLVGQTNSKAVATTRSIIFSVFAIYTTFGKQILSIFSVQQALILSAAVIIITNIKMSKKIINLK